MCLEWPKMDGDYEVDNCKKDCFKFHSQFFSKTQQAYKYDSVLCAEVTPP